MCLRNLTLGASTLLVPASLFKISSSINRIAHSTQIIAELREPRKSTQLSGAIGWPRNYDAHA
jgi:hypothetical protein